MEEVSSEQKEKLLQGMEDKMQQKLEEVEMLGPVLLPRGQIVDVKTCLSAPFVPQPLV